LEFAPLKVSGLIPPVPILAGKSIQNFSLALNEGEKNHKKGGGGLNCVFGNFFFCVLDNCPQVQSLK